MNRATLAAGLACLIAAPVLAQAQDNAVSAFLKAADSNDFATMTSLIKGDIEFIDGRHMSSAQFVGSLSNCYLRRVYRKDDTPGLLMATWMCTIPGKPDHSRVVIAQVTNAAQGLSVSRVFEQKDNPRPAPSRAGSAFDGGAKP